jgi:hypothetical protein
MDGLFSFLIIVVRIGMVIGGILAVVALFSGKKPRMSSREKKMAVVVVLGTLVFAAMLIAVVSKYG